MSVGLRDAHAWPELYFEGVGWTRFEPTPNRGSTPSYTQSNTPAGEIAVVPRPSLSSSTAPSTAPSASESCSAALRKIEGCPSQSSQVAAGSNGDGPPWYRVLLWALLGLVLVAVPLTPMLWRLRSRSVRLASAQHSPSASPLARVRRRDRSGERYADEVGMTVLPGETATARTTEVAVGHTLAVWRELTDTAWDYGIAPDDALTPRKAAERIVRLGRLEPETAGAVRRVAGAVEQVLYAPEPRSETGLVDDVRKLRASLRSTAGRRTRLRAIVAPPSAMRAVWAAADRWAVLRTRWATRWTALTRRPSEQRGG
jgi:hypothetical protein